MSDILYFTLVIIYIVSSLVLLGLIYSDNSIYEKYEPYVCYIPVLNTILVLKEFIIIAIKAIKA